jgi:hypothetical protein
LPARRAEELGDLDDGQHRQQAARQDAEEQEPADRSDHVPIVAASAGPSQHRSPPSRDDRVAGGVATGRSAARAAGRTPSG